MAVCSFLGNTKVYDVEIDSMLQNAIDRIVNENGKTEFLCYLSSTSDFFKQCFISVLKAKARHPGDITITLVFSEKDYSENGMERNRCGCLPLFLQRQAGHPSGI